MNKIMLTATLGMALVLLLPSAPAITVESRDVLERLQVLSSELNTVSDASRVAGIAEETGRVVDRARKQSTGPEKLELTRGLLGAMQSRVEQLLADAEQQTGQNEAALERLYRSQAWDDLSFAEASFIYWAAWIDLEMARSARSEKDILLARARGGFQTASLQLFRPGIFYGGWLGIGCVEMEQGHTARAQQIFAKLDEALLALPDETISRAISLEIRLQEARLGALGVSGRNIDAKQAEMLRMEMFAMLEQSRDEGRTLNGIAQRLQALIQAGYLDQQLLDDMMAYAPEIAALKIAPWNNLAAAEFRLRHEDYQKALQKYEAFFKEVIPPQEVNLDRSYYNWAFAAYKTGNYQAAVRILESLTRRNGLTAEVDKAAVKLLYTVHVARAHTDDTKNNSKTLQQAARQFIDKNPDDPEAEQARLYLAHSATDMDTSLKILRRIRSKEAFDGAVERATFQIIAREFNTRIASGKTKTAFELAHQGKHAYQALPKTEQENPLNIAALLQMRALIDINPIELLNSLEFLENLKNFEPEEQEALIAEHPDELIRLLSSALVNADQHPDIMVHQAVSWSRLQLYDRSGNWSGLTEWLNTLAGKNTHALPWELIYPWIATRADVSERLSLALTVHPAAATLPDMDRRLYRLIIESLLALRDHRTALNKALAFSREHPNSGDAWRLLARSAELSGNHFAADRAWRVITEKLTPSMEMWWEGMLQRTRIRSNSTRPEQACSLLEVLELRAAHLPESKKTTYETLLANTQCRRTDTAIQPGV